MKISSCDCQGNVIGSLVGICACRLFHVNEISTTRGGPSDEGGQKNIFPSCICVCLDKNQMAGVMYLLYVQNA